MTRRARQHEAAAPSGQLVVELADWKPELLKKRLDSNQVGMTDWWEKTKDLYSLSVVNASRQIGKSFWAVCLALICAFTNPGWQIKYGAKTQKHARGFIMPHFRSLLRDVPRERWPEWREEDSQFIFDNGSTITVAGCDRQYAEALTGQHAHLFIIDEGGAIRDLKFVVQEIALPQTLNTNGRLAIFSTPARSPGHAFKSFCDEAKENGTYLERTIFDNPRISNETIRKFCKLAGGPNSTTWAREYLVQHVTEESAAVVPEANASRMKLITITEERLKATRSALVDPYIVVVPEWNPNFTGVLWGHWDFGQQRIVIEDDLLMRKLDTAELVNEMTLRAISLWGAQKVFRTVAWDADDDLICDVSEQGWSFTGTSVKDFDTSNQRLRHSIKHRRGPPLYIHERCGDLRRQLENAVWSDKLKRTVERSEMDGFYPLLKAAVCLREDVEQGHDPAPRVPGRFRQPRRESSTTALALKRALNQ